MNDHPPAPPPAPEGETAASLQERLRETEKRFRQFAEHSASILWIAELASLRLEYLSPAYERVTGEPREPMLANIQQWNHLVHPEDREQVIAGARRVLEGETYVQEYRIVWPSDGDVRWIRGTGFPIPEEDGSLRRIGGIAQDITESKQLSERERRLWAELQLRVRNILAEVRSIAAKTAEVTEDPQEFFIHFDGRLTALGRTYKALTRAEDTAVDLEDMIRDELLAVLADDENRVEVQGPSVRLRGRAAEVIALTIHELTTNAVKYGALAAPAGKLMIRWRIAGAEDGRTLVLDWRESGVPAISAAPRRSGFGRALIERGLAYELGGSATLSFLGGGVEASISLPLESGNAILDEEFTS